VRRAVLYQLLSLDGVAEEPGDWMFDADEAIIENLARVIDGQDTILLGRGTFDYWVGYWPHEGPEPFHSFINSTPKHVITSTPLDAQWANTVPVNGSAADHVRALKEQEGGDIGIHGSIELARSLNEAGLIDDFRLVVAATVAGRGKRLFEGESRLRRLDLVDSRRTGGGSLLLHYRSD